MGLGVYTAVRGEAGGAVQGLQNNYNVYEISVPTLLLSTRPEMTTSENVGYVIFPKTLDALYIYTYICVCVCVCVCTHTKTLVRRRALMST
jgi:hypothetical protein